MPRSYAKTFEFIVDHAAHEVTLFSDRDGHQIRVGDRLSEIQARFVSENVLLLEIDGRRVTVYLVREGESWYVSYGGRQYVVGMADPDVSAGRVAHTQAFQADHVLVSPMPGQVVKIQVSEGDVVEKNQAMAIVEAMKMENELRASCRARVKKIYVQAGSLVDAGEVIVELEAEEG